MKILPAKDMDIKGMNKSLAGFTDVTRFVLALDEESGRFYVKLTLANALGQRVRLICRDVQNLELNPAGNGFNRMFQLEVTDMRDDGLERIRFSLEETERETLFLHCAEIELETV